MYVTPSQFLTDFPEFDTSGDTDPQAVQFDPAQIQFWINRALRTLNPCRWDDSDDGPRPSDLDYGVELFTAHNLVLGAIDARDGQVGGIPGVAKGAIAATSAGDVAVSYDTANTMEFDAGHWNLTTYGKRFIRLARMMGAGPLQVGPDSCTGPNSGPAWSGPPFYNWPNPSS